MSTTQPTRHPPEVVEAAKQMHTETGERLWKLIETLTGEPRPESSTNSASSGWPWSDWLFAAYRRGGKVLHDALVQSEAKLACAEAERDEAWKQRDEMLTYQHQLGSLRTSYAAIESELTAERQRREKAEAGLATLNQLLKQRDTEHAETLQEAVGVEEERNRLKRELATKRQEKVDAELKEASDRLAVCRCACEAALQQESTQRKRAEKAERELDEAKKIISTAADALKNYADAELEERNRREKAERELAEARKAIQDAALEIENGVMNMIAHPSVRKMALNSALMILKDVVREAGKGQT